VLHEELIVNLLKKLKATRRMSALTTTKNKRYTHLLSILKELLSLLHLASKVIFANLGRDLDDLHVTPVSSLVVEDTTKEIISNFMKKSNLEVLREH